MLSLQPHSWWGVLTWSWDFCCFYKAGASATSVPELCWGPLRCPQTGVLCSLITIWLTELIRVVNTLSLAEYMQLLEHHKKQSTCLVFFKCTAMVTGLFSPSHNTKLCNADSSHDPLPKASTLFVCIREENGRGFTSCNPSQFPW